MKILLTHPEGAPGWFHATLPIRRSRRKIHLFHFRSWLLIYIPEGR